FQKRYGLVAKRVVAGGLSSTLALSFFSSAPHVEVTDVDRSKPKNFDIIVREADKLYDGYLIENAYNILKRWGSSDCSELLWRLARVLCEKAKLSNDKAERTSLMYEAFAVVKKAIEKEPKGGCFGAHKWYAILLDYVGEIEGNKSRILKSYEVNVSLHYFFISCFWHFSFADMGYTKRLLAKTIFATPPTSTYEKALSYFLKAEEISPCFYSANTYYIGEVYEKIGDKDVAINYYKEAFKMPVVTADDHSIHKKAHEKLRKAGIKDTELV
ncbi:hypothetical protein Angca_006429, partial [Angiostrongylus cantonensis]